MKNETKEKETERRGTSALTRLLGVRGMKELNSFSDWIIATNNTKRLENGEIIDLFKEYELAFFKFWDNLDTSSTVGNFKCDKRVSDYFYNLINEKTPHASAES